MKKYTVQLTTKPLSEYQINSMTAYMKKKNMKYISCMDLYGENDTVVRNQLRGILFCQTAEEVSDIAADLLDYACIPCDITNPVCEVSVCIQYVLGADRAGEHIGIKGKASFDFVYIRKQGLDAFNENGIVIDTRNTGN